MANKELKQHKKGDKIKWIITTALISILSIGLIAVGVKVSNNDTTKTLQNNLFTFEIGAIDESGEYLKDTSSAVMKDFITTNGLQIEIKEDANVTYTLHFYNEDKEYISSSSELTDNFDGSIENAIPDGAEFVKIEVTPLNDAEVSLFEINGYVGQLVVTVNK